MENDVGYTQRNFFSPLLRINDYAELNQLLVERCEKDMDRHIRGQEAPVSELWEVERAKLLALPRQDYPSLSNPTRESQSIQPGGL